MKKKLGKRIRMRAPVSGDVSPCACYCMCTCTTLKNNASNGVDSWVTLSLIQGSDG